MPETGQRHQALTVVAVATAVQMVLAMSIEAGVMLSVTQMAGTVSRIGLGVCQT